MSNDYIVIKSSPILLAFYKDWLANVVAAPITNATVKCYGLCRNLDTFLTKVTREDTTFAGYNTIRAEMKQQFERAGLDRSYPFSSEAIYYRQSDYEIQHLDPARIAWVCDRIADGVIEDESNV